MNRIKKMKKIFNNNRRNNNFRLLVTLLFFVLEYTIISAQTTTFTATGTYTVPAGVTAIKVETWGGGGGGATRSTNNANRYGGGGGGGAYASSTITVTAGTGYNVVVGGGGTAGNGGTSSVFGSNVVVAAGGSGVSTNSRTGGAGGTTAASTGTTKYAGGTGGTGSANGTSGGSSGAGGGGAGSNGAGGNASEGTAGIGTAQNGGDGATGVAAGNNGTNGNNYGGGGSGGATNSSTDRTGGIGANGLVVVTEIRTVEVNATLGTTLTYYTTLKGAFDKINDGTHKGVITIKINDNTTETATAALNASGATSPNYSSVTIYPTKSGLSVSGSLATPLIQLNGADNVTIDGRVNQSGSTDLTITNTNTSAGARTIELINSAQNNIVQYCTIIGAGATTTQGVINISNSTSGAGNDENYIQYNSITSVAAASRPVNAIFSLGSSGYENNNNVIRNNKIYDFLKQGTASNGIFISSYSSGYTITGNSFYETASFAPTDNVEYAVIRINNTSGNDFVISDNYIGGTSASCGGTAWTKTNAFNNTFHAIFFRAGNTNNSIQGNTIQNFSYSNSGAAIWYGITLKKGSALIGTATGNTIGASTGTGSITFTAGATNAEFNGIYMDSITTVDCSKNIIGSITATNAAAYATHFYGIFKSAYSGTTTISNNFIGSTTTSNSINASSTATGTAQFVHGIYTLGTGSTTISNNTVSNIINGTSETTLLSKTRGIFANAGSNSITGNSVYSIKTRGTANALNYTDAALIGISIISKADGTTQEISNNTVYNLENTTTSTTVKFETYGIYLDGPTTSTSIISRNFVHTFIVPSGSSAGTYLHGISIYDGNVTLTNNIIYLGNNITIGCSIWGLWTNSNDNVKIYHNTVYISGTATGGSNNSFAFRSLNCPSSLDIRNNILWDGRKNNPDVTTHYALYLNCTSNLTINYNDYQYSNGFGTAGGTTYTSFTNWKTAFNVAPNYNESNSLNVNPYLVNLDGTSPIDYQSSVQLQGDTLLLTESPTDFDEITRVTPTMGAWEFFANPVEVWENGIYKNAYTTLKGAFDVVNAGTYKGKLTIIFRGNTTETATATLNASGTGSADYSHILIYPGRTGIKVTGKLAAPLVELDGADKVTFDGKVNGNSTPYEFTFNNDTTLSGSTTFRFKNSAIKDSIRYCNIKGGCPDASGGIIHLSTSTLGNGNDSIVISNNNITSASATKRPVNAILSLGTTGRENSGVQIINNNIYNFFHLSSNSYGVNINSYSTDFTVSNNSLYETTSFTPTSGVNYYPINVNGNHTISGNYIGGSAANCSGTFTKNNGYGNQFVGITVNNSSTTASIQGNVIKNISWSNTGNSLWYGIYIQAGKVNIGTATGNTIGAGTGTGAISVTNTTTGANVMGINISSSDSVYCQNNIVGSITGANGATLATNVYGIYKSASTGVTVVSKNTIGSTTTSNSINASSTSTSNPQYVFGISSDGTGNVTISENVIANLNNATSNTTTATGGRINGITLNAGSANTVTDNTIRNLSIANANNTTGTTASVIGINLYSTSPTRTISGNTIYNLSNSYTSFTGHIHGIYYEGSTSGTNTVSRNFIYGLTTAATSGSPVINGIRIVSGVTTYSNNIINIGTSGVTSRNIIYGIYDTGAASQTCNLYFNTIYLAGTEGGVNNSANLYSATNNNTRNFRNNIYSNARTGGTGAHYCAYFNYTNTTGLTSNYNDYYRTGTTSYIARYNATNYTTLPFGADVSGNSVIQNPTFNSAGSTVATDYKVGVTLNGINGTGITTDYGSYSRPETSPTMGAWESNVNKWKGNTSNDWNTASNWTGNLVPGVDANIVFDDAPANHCVMDQNRSVTNITNAQSTYRMVTNGKKLTVKGTLYFTNGAQIDARSTNSEIEFAGAVAQSIPAGSLYNDSIYNLTMNNANNVILNGTLKLLKNLTATSGKLDAYTNSPTFSYSGSAVQYIENNLFLNNKAYNLTINNSAGVNLNTDFTVSNNMVINSGKKLTISVSNKLLVQGTVTNSAGTSGLVIKASSVAPGGSFIFYNSAANPVQATVEMYSKAYAGTYNGVSYSNYKWQYFGIPVTKMTKAPATFNVSTTSYVRKWVESGTTISNHWIQLVDTNTIYSFKGYEITQGLPKTLSFTGTLVNSNYSSGKLAYTPSALYPGQNILANPYLAAIDIKQLDFGTQTEWTVYLYNSGSYADWNNTGGATTPGNNPGQYTAIPKYLAGYAGLPATIPSMQAFLVKANSDSNDATLNFSYSSAVTKNTEMQRAPGKAQNTLDEYAPITVVTVKGATQADRMWLFTQSGCSHNYDNGWDGTKTLSTSTPQIYASEADGNYQTNSVDDINNTVLGFYPGTTDTIFTISFDHTNTEEIYPNMYLVDLKKDTVINISESGVEYRFTRPSSDTLVNRFKIVTSNEITTEIEEPINPDNTFRIYNHGNTIFVNNSADNQGYLYIYDAAGQMIEQRKVGSYEKSSFELKLPAGVYFAKGIAGIHQQIARFIIK